jgi:anti-anti-sigma factor
MKSRSLFDSEDFQIDIVNGISIIKVNLPRTTFNKADEFKQLLDTLLAAKHTKIIIDFSNCHYIDSMVVGVMVKSVKDVRKKKGDILVITPSGSINVMFARTGLYKIFKQFWSIEKAIESFSETN